MRLFGYIVLACVWLGLAQMALSALLVVAIILLIFGIFFRPAETFGFLAFGVLSSLFERHPLAASTLIGLTIVAGMVLSRRRRADDRTTGPLLLTAETSPKDDEEIKY